jgi:hypothetical protein
MILKISISTNITKPHTRKRPAMPFHIISSEIKKLLMVSVFIVPPVKNDRLKNDHLKNGRLKNGRFAAHYK